MMGFKSIAQQQKLQLLVKEGKLDQRTYDQMVAYTNPNIALPNRITKPKPVKVNKLTLPKKRVFGHMLP
jgi:hypothetical protein